MVSICKVVVGVDPPKSQTKKVRTALDSENILTPASQSKDEQSDSAQHIDFEEDEVKEYSMQQRPPNPGEPVCVVWYDAQTVKTISCSCIWPVFLT